MDTAVVLGALVLVSYLAAAGAVLPGVQPDRASPPSDLSHLREARRPSGCSLRAERHVHWYERMQPEPAAEGDASASSSSSPSAAARRPEVPLPRRLLPPSLLSSLPPSSHSSARALSSTVVPHLQIGATSPNMNISMVHPLNNKTCKGWERAVLNNLCNSVGGP